MRKFIAGDGSDASSAADALLAQNTVFHTADLFLIGDVDDPNALRLTSWSAPLTWPPFGPLFLPSVLNRASVASQIGFQVSTTTVEWSPVPTPFLGNLTTTSPYHKARVGLYNQNDVRIWRALMPTQGDCMTIGCMQLFGGRVSGVTVEVGKITLNVNSWEECTNQKIPLNTIEATNSMAGFMAGVPPNGLNVVPQFSVASGSSVTVISGDCTSPNAHQIFDDNSLKGGYLVFNSGPGNTLGGYYSAIQQNTSITVGLAVYNQFILFNPLPFAPTVGVDTFYVSGPNPNIQTDGSYKSFPYVPSNVSAA